jgi:hypothetical protein
MKCMSWNNKEKVTDIYFPLKCMGISGVLVYDKILTSLPILCITKLHNSKTELQQVGQKLVSSVQSMICRLRLRQNPYIRR